MTFYEEVDALDKILKHEVPTRADLDKIDSIRKDSALVRYFFEKLSSPSWVKPLREKGVFDHSEIVRQDGEYLIAQTWPESQYLARVAKQAAQDAIEIVLDVETDNPRVIQDFLDVLCEINADLAVRAVPGKIKKWIESPYLSSNICKKFGKFATALIRANKIQKALKIIDVVLKMKPQQVDREKTKKGLETWDFSRIPEAEGRFKTNRLDEFAKEIETDILKTAPQKVGELYVEKLTNALRFDKHAYGLPVNEISDLSYIWRPTIGSSKGGYGPDKYKDMFIDGI